MEDNHLVIGILQLLSECRTRRGSYVLIPILAAGACSLCSAASESGKVSGVHDGDTLTLTTRTGTQKIRLDGIDAPELNQPFGEASRQWLSGQVLGKEVVVTWKRKDRNGRLIGRLRLASRDLNVESVRAGMAWWFTEYARKDEVLKKAELSARTAKEGLWGTQPSAVAPWVWRSTKRTINVTKKSAAPMHPPRASFSKIPTTSVSDSRRSQNSISVLLGVCALTVMVWYALAVGVAHAQFGRTGNPNTAAATGLAAATVFAATLATLLSHNMGQSLLFVALTLLTLLIIFGLTISIASSAANSRR